MRRDCHLRDIGRAVPAELSADVVGQPSDAPCPATLCQRPHDPVVQVERDLEEAADVGSVGVALLEGEVGVGRHQVLDLHRQHFAERGHVGVGVRVDDEGLGDRAKRLVRTPRMVGGQAHAVKQVGRLARSGTRL
jgi:hypothetical protein